MGDLKLLRQLALCDKEFKITQVTAAYTPAKFTSQLDNPKGRKIFLAYNATTDTDSGEAMWGASDLDPALLNGMPIPIGAWVAIPIAYDDEPDETTFDIYFCSNTSGEIADLRILEGA